MIDELYKKRKYKRLIDFPALLLNALSSGLTAIPTASKEKQQLIHSEIQSIFRIFLALSRTIFFPSS